MIRSISFVMVLLLTVATSSLFAAGGNCTPSTCSGASCQVCHPEEAGHTCPTEKMDHECTGESCEICHPSELSQQSTCPVMGSDIDKSIYSDYNGDRVYFCCSMCVSKFDADPETYLQVIKDNGEEPEHIVNIDG